MARFFVSLITFGRIHKHISAGVCEILVAFGHSTLEAKSNINPNASVGAPNPGTNGTHTKILDFDSKGA